MASGTDVGRSGQSLFRNEVIVASGASTLGGIRIGRQPGFAAATVVALGLVAGLAAFAVCGQVTRKARVAGVLLPSTGSVALAAPQAGVLLEQRVQEGHLVAAQQVLFVLGTDRATVQGNTADLIAQSLAQRRATLETERSLRLLQARQRMQSLNDRLRHLLAEQQRAEQEAVLARRRVELAAKSAERYTQLSAGGFVADVQAQQKQEELIEQQGRAEAAQRGALVVARELQAVQAELSIAATQRDTEVAQIERGLAALGQEAAENRARQQVMIVAPQAGRITGLTQHAAGVVVQAGQTLATLSPPVHPGPLPDGSEGADAPLQAHLYAPSRTAGFVRPGQAVWLRYAAFPYQKFGLAAGEVVDVGRTPIAPQDLPAGHQQALLVAARSHEALYRIVVDLGSQTIQAYGRPLALKAGMTLDADVVQDRRAVWEWVLEPLLSHGRSSIDD